MSAKYTIDVVQDVMLVRVELPAKTQFSFTARDELRAELQAAMKKVLEKHLEPYACLMCGHDEPPRMDLYEGQDWPRCPSCMTC